MRIGIIDADLLGRKKHRFPNLACEKISGYYKDHGHSVELVLDYNDMNKYDKVFISKVFTDTQIAPHIIQADNVEIGGTGFYFDKAPALPECIEHNMPDYHLYDEFIKKSIKATKKPSQQQFRFYTDYSIGFLTRGCFRKCGFCVNQKYNHVFMHSQLDEFLDHDRKKLCLLDDNFFGHPQWKMLLQKVIDTNKPFVFKQGLDERLLTEEKCEMLFSAKYDGDVIFAFDNITDYDLIHKKLKIIRKYKGKKNVKFYVLVGFESTDAQDILNAFKRIALLFRYGCLPYIMRFQNKNDMPWKMSEFRSLYITLARWCNQPSIVKKMSFRDFCELNQEVHKNKDTLCSSMDAMRKFEKRYPEIAKYFDIRFENR